MRVHLPALIALVSVTTYVACGSSDPSSADQEAGAGGALGEGGEPSSSGGSEDTAGSKNTAGDSSMAGSSAGPGGEGGGASSAEGGAGGVAAGGDANGAQAGAGGAPDEGGLPAACPGVLGDYTQVDGTTGPDTFTSTQLEGKLLVFGLEGDDVFDRNHSGNDCLVGGPGDDDLTNPGESASYLIGGAGADTFHLVAQTNNYAQIADMSAEDTIGLSKTTFTFLGGTAGATVASYQLYSLADYEAGTGSIPAGEGAALVYDPATGGIWQDLDRGVKGSSQADAAQIATVLNHASYTFDPEDFVLDD
jgi:hypothetical protein